MGASIWDISLGIFGLRSLALDLWIGISGLRSWAWDLWLRISPGIVGLGPLALDPGSGSFPWDLWLGIFGFGSLASDLRLGIFGLGSLAWGAGILRLGEPPGRFQGNPAGRQATTGLQDIE